MGRIFEYAILLGYLSLVSIAVQSHGDVVSPVVGQGADKSVNYTYTSFKHQNDGKENVFAKRIGEEGHFHHQRQGHWNHVTKNKSNQMSKSPGLSSYSEEPGGTGNRRRNLAVSQSKNGFNHPYRYRDASRRGFIPPFSQELLPAKIHNKYPRNGLGGRSLPLKERPPRLPTGNNDGSKSFGQTAQESRNFNSYRKFNHNGQHNGGRNFRFHHQRQNSKVCNECNSVPWVPMLNVPSAYRQQRYQHFDSHKHNTEYPAFDFHAMSSNNQDFLLPSTPLVPPTPAVLDGTISSSYGLPAGNIPTGHGLLAPLNHVVSGHNSFSSQSADYSNALTYFTPPSILDSSPIPELSPVPIVPIYDSGPFFSGHLLDSSDIGLVPPTPNTMSVSNVVFTISEENSHTGGSHKPHHGDTLTAQSTNQDNLNFKPSSGVILNAKPPVHGNVQNNLNFQQPSGVLSPIGHSTVNNNLQEGHGAGLLTDVKTTTYTNVPGNFHHPANLGVHPTSFGSNSNVQNTVALQQPSGSGRGTQPAHSNFLNNFEIQQSPNIFTVHTSQTNDNLNYKHNLIDTNDSSKDQYPIGTQNQQTSTVDVVKSVPLAEFSNSGGDQTIGFSKDSIVLQNPHGDQNVVNTDPTDFVPPPPPPPPYYNITGSQSTVRHSSENLPAEQHLPPSFPKNNPQLDASSSWLFLDAHTASKGSESSTHQVITQPDQVPSVVNGGFQPISPVVQNTHDKSQNKKIQIIIPYTTKSKTDLDTNSFESVRHEVFETLQSLSNKSELEYLAKFNPTSGPTVGTDQRHTSQGNLNATSGKPGEIDRNKKYVTEMQHILAKNIKELLLREIEQTGKQNYPLQNNIDNWTALEYSNHKTTGNTEAKELISKALSVTTIPGTSISHILLPSKKIPEEYLVTTPSPYFEDTLNDILKMTNTSVHSRPFTARPQTSTTVHGGNYTVVGQSRVNYWGGKINDNLVLPETSGSTRSVESTTTTTAAVTNGTSLSSQTNKIEIVTPVSVTPRKSETTRRTTRHVRVTERTIFKKTNNTARQYFQRLRSSSARKNNTAAANKSSNSTKLENVTNSFISNRKNQFRNLSSFKSRRRNHTELVKTTTTTTTKAPSTSTTVKTESKIRSENSDRNKTTIHVVPSLNTPVKNKTETVKKDNSTYVKLFPVVSAGEETRNSTGGASVDVTSTNATSKSEDLQSINDIFPFRNKELPWEAFDVSNSRQNGSRERKSLIKQVKSRRPRTGSNHSIRTESSGEYSELGTVSSPGTFSARHTCH
ncbi:hypothetical protein RUM43_014947 [Polyplax serrata]|uniref:Uncharacterized protein n=1 Tax=Polyplax serrata TaxID=468196 RepID=A0AAN8PHZ1_POLSC